MLCNLNYINYENLNYFVRFGIKNVLSNNIEI